MAILFFDKLLRYNFPFPSFIPDMQSMFLEFPKKY